MIEQDPWPLLGLKHAPGTATFLNRNYLYLPGGIWNLFYRSVCYTGFSVESIEFWIII